VNKKIEDSYYIRHREKMLDYAFKVRRENDPLVGTRERGHRKKVPRDVILCPVCGKVFTARRPGDIPETCGDPLCYHIWGSWKKFGPFDNMISYKLPSGNNGKRQEIHLCETCLCEFETMGSQARHCMKCVYDNFRARAEARRKHCYVCPECGNHFTASRPRRFDSWACFRKYTEKHGDARLWKNHGLTTGSIYKIRGDSYKTMSQKLKYQVWKRDNWICQICFEPIDENASRYDPLSRSVDHIIERANGGTNDIDNLRAAHLKCNVERWQKENYGQQEKAACNS
jgi:rRNA maturation protein Nop10